MSAFYFCLKITEITAGLSAARFLETSSPALLKVCSLGTDVGEAANGSVALVAQSSKRRPSTTEIMGSIPVSNV